MSFLIKQPLDFEDRFNIAPDIEPLISTTFLGLEKRKLGFPKPQHIGRQLGYLTDFSDFIEDFTSQPWLIPHDRSLREAIEGE